MYKKGRKVVEPLHPCPPNLTRTNIGPTSLSITNRKGVDISIFRHTLNQMRDAMAQS